jgi:hypothetical protein
MSSPDMTATPSIPAGRSTGVRAGSSFVPKTISTMTPVPSMTSPTGVKSKNPNGS